MFLLVENRLAEFHSEVTLGGDGDTGDIGSGVAGDGGRGVAFGSNGLKFHGVSCPRPQLELLTEAEREIEAVAFPVRLEQYLMVGAFNKVLEAKAAIPLPAYAFFMAAIVATVRAAVAECAAVAYGSLSLAAAQQLLLLDSRADLLAFIANDHADWVVEGETITFAPAAGSKSAEVQSMRLISEALNYATELERIV